MKTLMMTAMHSGAGKTVVSCALLAALKKRGFRMQAFKSGPDYIDPMFHSRVLGVPSRNLDLFLQGEQGVLRTFGRADAELSLTEGAMGYYDGLNGTDEASAYALARLTGMPAVLVLRPQGSALSLAAQVKGMTAFRQDSGIRALLLSACTEKNAAFLSPLLERETGLPVLGFLPPLPAARFESRHLGLKTAAEIDDLKLRMDALAEEAEKSIDIDRLLALSGDRQTRQLKKRNQKPVCTIAVACDEAFCFLYEDNLDALREAGAELRFFSPLRDRQLPEGIAGLYLPGGYPELYAAKLSENQSMRRSVAEAVGGGLPTVAECGGFLYLQKSLEDPEGKAHDMCALLPGAAHRTEGLKRFGYLMLEAPADSLLFRAGEEIPAHEFHYWDSSENGNDLIAKKADGRNWRCAYASESLYAAFPHLHFGGAVPLGERFVRACETWKNSKKS